LESIQIAFQLLFFMFCLFVLGEPWRIILRKFARLFKSLDVLQILVVNVYLGGFFLYIIAIIPLHLFTAITLYVITILSGIVALLFHRRKFRSAIQNLSLRPKFSFQSRHSFEMIMVASMFLFSLFIQTLPFNYLLLGSVRDTAIHSLFAKVLIENRQIPITLEPYLSEGIIYPQGFSPIVAYSALVLNYSTPQAVLYLTSLFNVLTILGAYFLGKTLSLSRKLRMGLSLAFVFAFVASWPKYITWGSNALVASLPFYFICLGLFPFLIKDKMKVKAILAVGFLFGYLSVLHLQVYEMLIASLFVLWLYIAIKKEKGRWVRLGYFVAISSVSLVVLSPFIIRQIAFYSNPYHNIGVPADVEPPIPQPGLSIVLMTIKWLLENLAVDPLLKVASFVLVFVSLSMMVILRRKDRDAYAFELFKLGIAMLLGLLLISLLAAISPGDLPFYPQPLLLYLPFYFFIATLNYPLYHFFFSYLLKKIPAKGSRSEIKTRNLLVAAISFMLLLGVYSPFLYQSVIFDAGRLYGSYSVFGVTTEQDLKLISWIRNNLPRNATILVNNFQGGSFIPSIANCKVVFPSFGSSTSVTYRELVALLEESVLNATTLDLMKRFNITDIYVGSGVSPWDNGIHKWNPQLFLGNPHFKLMKNFGNAYLFRCNYTDTSIVFLDDFEHTDWNENGWQTQYDGNGLGNVTITNDFGYRSQKSLRITSQAIYTISEWKYARYISREIFTLNDSDVTLSFYLRATEGFHGKDTFAVIVSNAYRDQSMIIMTPHGVYEGYANAKTLNGFEGLVHCNLTASWRQFFNSSLPSTFALEFVNWDFDGIKNIAYIDDVALTVATIT